MPYIKYCRVLGKMFLLVAFPVLLTGCVSHMALDYGTTNELMEPVSYYLANGKTIIKVKSTYCHMIDTEARPIRKFEPRTRYLILEPHQITLADEKKLKETTPALKAITQIYTLHVPSDGSVLPKDFWAPSANDDQLPISHGNANSRQIEKDELIPLKYNNKTLYLCYKDVRIYSDRDDVKWWTYPLFYTGIVVDLPFGLIGGILGIE